MNTRGAIFNLCKSTNACFEPQITSGYNGLNNLSSNKNLANHRTTKLKYPAAKSMLLPNNLQSVVLNESGLFSPQRTKDINGAFPVFHIQSRAIYDPRIGLYDSNEAVSLNSSMQSNIPGDQQSKFISNDLKLFRYSNIYKKEGTRTFHTLTNRLQNDIIFLSRSESTNTPEKEPELSRKDKLKRAVKEYGSTVIIFHVGISLVSLGTCYVLISSGVDMGKLLLPLGVSGGVMTNAGTFVTAYAIHKVFAPVRISITLGATPFIVRYLRHIGFLKKPKVK